MPHFFRLLLQFNKSIWLYNLFFSAVAVYTLGTYGIAILIMAVILKFMSYAAAAAYNNYFSPHFYYYYRNAGYGVVKLYAYAFMADFIFFILLLLVYLSIFPYQHA